MTHVIDLNCDLGEYDDVSSDRKDAAIMPFISSCNVACGAHAGNLKVIDHTTSMALANNVKVGAHPSFPDRANFGRQVMHLKPHELKLHVEEQIRVVKSAVEAQGGQLSHVKPHGALYNQAALNYELSVLLLETVANLDDKLSFYGLAHSMTAKAATEMGLNFVAEGFVDRGYTAQRTLVDRSAVGALIADPIMMLKRAIQMIQVGEIEAVTGQRLKLSIQTLCLHGDHKNAAAAAKILYAGLKQAGILIQSSQPSCQA